jgi:hypothetical protein
MTRLITGVYKDNLAELIGRLAGAGRDDPTIAHHVGITVSQVRRLRAEFAIPAGERRWLPVTQRPVSNHAATPFPPPQNVKEQPDGEEQLPPSRADRGRRTDGRQPSWWR